MNRTEAVIQSIEVSDTVHSIKLNSNGQCIYCMTLVLDQSINIGDRVIVSFKETSLILCSSPMPECTIENQFPARVDSINEGQILAEIRFNSAIGDLSAVVLKKFVERLSLNQGQNVVIFIPETEISLT